MTLPDRTNQLVEDAKTAIRIHEGVLALKAERDALELALNSLEASIEREGYEVLHDISTGIYSVRPRE